jgi:glycerophosphoryl diester phosphodiesterase
MARSSPGAAAILARSARDVRRSFGDLLRYDLLFTAVGFAVLAPSLAWLFRRLASSGGDVAYGNVEIASYVLTPLGLTTVVACAAVLCTISFARFAGFMSIGYGAASERRVSWYDALGIVASRLPMILGLSFLVLLILAAAALPFVVAAFLTAKRLLGAHDINFYLDTRPPEFVTAVGIGFVLALGAGVVLSLVAAPLIFVLPQAVLGRGSARAALRTSRALARAVGIGRIAALVLAWIAAWVVASCLVNAGLHFLGRQLVRMAGENLGVLLAVLGGLTAAGFVLNLLVSLAASAVGCVACVDLYLHACRLSGVDVSPPAGVLAPAGGGRWLSPRAALWTGVAGALGVALVAAHQLIETARWEDHVEISAHRGASRAAPENTLSAIERAIADGADYVEVDVQRTSDGVLVVNHDADLMRVGRSPLVVSRSTYDELRMVDVGSHFSPEFAQERLPALAQVFDAAAGRAKVIVEFKSYRGDAALLVADVVRMIRERDLAEDVVVMSLNHSEVREAKRLAPELDCGLIVSVSIGDVSRLEVDFLAVSRAKATDALIAAVHASGKRVFVWTVDDPADMSTMIDRGADNLITNDVSAAVGLLKERAGLGNVERLLLRFKGLYL